MEYVTLEDGMDFRTIAKIMSSSGMKMNHATARNVLLLGLKKLLGDVAKELGQHPVTQDLDLLIKNTKVHEQLGDLLFQAEELRRKR